MELSQFVLIRTGRSLTRSIALLEHLFCPPFIHLQTATFSHQQKKKRASSELMQCLMTDGTGSR